MKIVITGALGHIGSRLIRDVSVWFENPEIVLVDSLLTQRYCSLFDLPANARYRLEAIDILLADVDLLLDGADVVIHLAAITDAAGSFERAEEVERNNFSATRAVAEACARRGIRLLTFSSTSVYGTQSAVVDENCSEEELQPQSPYAHTKLKEERLVQELAKTQGLRVTTFRCGTIFGVSAGMRFHTAVNKFCWQAAFGQPLTVWETAYEQKRPYLDLLDASKAIEHVLRSDLFDGTLYNVITLNATVRDIVDTIRAYVPTLQVNFVSNRIMNQLSYEVDDRRFRNTGFTPHGNLKDSILQELCLLNPRIRDASGAPVPATMVEAAQVGSATADSAHS